ncbi:bicoid stability factor [Temnothorax americanus]|uniref:bicoid stability factor n=1 Tax=Temnothorax americanus TaxID=1964332 RepID=UPI004068FFFE
MLEVEKMLQLRRYLTLIVRSQLRSPRYETVRSHPPRRGGYVVGYVLHRHAGLRPEICVATCNRTYGTTAPQSSQSDVVDQKLMSFCDDIKKGRVSADGLREVINLCNKNDYHLPHDTGVLLLKCCGNLLPDLEATERDHLAGQVWRLAKKNDKALTLEYYNTLLGINEENSKFVSPKKFLTNMIVEPDENTYRLLLNAATKTGNSEYLGEILSMIKDKNIAVYEEAVNALVQIYVTNGNIAEVERTITLMREAELPTAKAYTELACGYARLGDIPNLVKILNEEPQSNTDLLRIIKALSMSNNSRHIPVVLNFLMTSVPEIEFEISRMIAELVRADQVTDAHAIITCLAMNNVTKDIVQSFVNSFMNELVMINAPIDDIIKYANDFADSGYSRRTLTDLADIGLKLGREKLCLALFQAMRSNNIEIRPHYYWPLLLRGYRDKGEAEIFSLVKSMVNEGVEIDSDTLLDYVFPYVNTADPITILRKLLLNNVPGAVSFTPLLAFLLHNNRLQDLTSLCKHYTRYKVYYKELMRPLVRAYLATKDVKNCVMLLTASPQGQDFAGLFLKLLLKAEYPVYIEDLQLLLEELQKCEIKISREDATVLKDRLKQNENFNVTTKVANLINNLVDPNIKISALNRLHPKYMTTKELTYYLMELKSEKVSTKNVLHKLLVAYCNENNLKRAEEIKREYDACQYEWTSGMRAILFELYLKHNKLDEAEALLPDLQVSPAEFQINKFKVVTYATALVKANKPTKAFDVIDTFNAIDDTNADAQAPCCTLLQTLAESQYHAHAKDMLDLLVRKNYCQVTTELLRPLVAIPLERDNILDTVDVFAECAQKYGKAPLALQLLTALLEQKDGSRLHNANNYIEQVYNITADTYSVKVANTLLAIALATLDKTEKLQALLENHGLSMNCLVYYIVNAKTDSDIDGFLNLFKIANANHLDEDVICNKLLSVYSKTGNCDRALELWKIMRTKNIEPSEQFKKNFIQFLLSNKVSLPPELDRKAKRR